MPINAVHCLQYPSSCGPYTIRYVRDLTTGYDNSQPDNKAVSIHIIDQMSDSPLGAGSTSMQKLYMLLIGEPLESLILCGTLFI